jgi:membrane-bound serine protease (ClpP class)
MLATVVLAMVDMYPGPPTLPTLPQLEVPFRDLSFAALGSVAVIFVLSRILPRTALYGALVTQSASGVVSVEAEEEEQSAQLGQEGVSLSNLRPGGKAQFGERILDVITQGDLIPKGRRVRIIGHSGREAIVEPVGN